MNLHKMYKDLHQIPELAYKEVKTRKYITEILEKRNIKYENLKSGIIVKIEVNNTPFIGFRTEIDALSVKETNDVSYKSKKNMHACGHDMHISIIMGILLKTFEKKDELQKNVIFIFQAGEESGNGAYNLVNEYNWPSMNELYAFHNSNIIDINNVGLQKGQINSFVYDFDINFKGQSSHIAQPYLGKDAITCGVEFINSIRLNQAYEFGAHKQYSINFTNINTKNDNNRVSDNCRLRGTIRVGSLDIKEKVLKFFNKTLQSITDLNEIPYTMSINQVESTINSEKIHNDLVYKLDRYILMDSLSSGGDDFSSYSKISNIYLLKIGSRWEEEHLNNPVHQGNFLPNYNGIEYGVEIGLTILDINK